MMPWQKKNSEQPHGPWRTIAENLPNTGRHDWKVNPNVKGDIYLQLEVRDRAGNIGRDTISDPLNTDGLAPRARIRDVVPAR